MIVAYVSGHGFGHATRTGEVLRSVGDLDPRIPLTVVTSGPERLYRQALGGGFAYRFLECDVGLAQKDALVIDEEGTVLRWRECASRHRALVATEALWLRRAGAKLVLGDIPPLAFQAAAEAGLPGIALANFSWDWVYRHLARRHPALGEASEAAAEGYRRAGLLLELPFAGDMPAFPRREKIPLVARRPRVRRDEARRRLGLPPDRPSVLLSFGGLGIRGFDRAVLAPLTEFLFLDWDDAGAERLDSLGLRYEDVVGAVDVVVTKPGYGIVSDAIGAGTRLLYTDRGDFPEYPILVGEMGRYLPATYVSQEDLMAGRLRGPLGDVLAKPFPPRPDVSGAERAARRLLDIAS